MFVGIESLKDLDFQNIIFESLYVLASDFYFFLDNTAGKIIGEEKTSADFQVEPRYRYQIDLNLKDMTDTQKYKFSSVFGQNIPDLSSKDKIILEWLAWPNQDQHKSGFIEVSAVIDRFHKEELRDEKLAEKRKAEKREEINQKTRIIEVAKLQQGLTPNGQEAFLVKEQQQA